jgi:hypothetical protein
MPSDGEAGMLWLCKVAGLPAPEAEYAFAKPRRWRFDLAWPLHLIAVEIEGGTWSYGRHSRGNGYAADLEKYNEATIAGWRVLRVTTDQVKDRSAITVVLRAFRALAAAPVPG